ncbi:MAG: endolytic transglycosylase MltG [Fimbriimonadales bacterium]|nr:endolytic transglycosylase MltG [Fimbriimonadales bacterium]
MRRRAVVVAGLFALGAIGGVLFFRWLLRPTEPGVEWLVRFERGAPLQSVLSELGRRGIVRSPAAMRLYLAWRGDAKPLARGTYRFRSGRDAEGVRRDLREPLRQMVRIPEGWWIARIARLLERKQVCSAEEYLRLARTPGAFQRVVSFRLPEGSLEGYLYPDTYDLPPLLGAKAVIERQLETFERRFLSGRKPPANLHEIVTVASMVELEAARDEERPRIAGVIENRLRRGMPLQVDATVNYALQEWRPLAVSEYRSVRHPYNTYLDKGLPPGPIGNPSLASLKAAENPERHEFLFYVAKPSGGTHWFSRSYAEHLRRVAERRAALRGAAR